MQIPFQLKIIAKNGSRADKKVWKRGQGKNGGKEDGDKGGMEDGGREEGTKETGEKKNRVELPHGLLYSHDIYPPYNLLTSHV